jgi:hypothetical protein
MKNIANKSQLLLAFLSGALLLGLLQVSPLKAATGAPTGSCAMLGNYSTWGWPSAAGKQKEYSEMSVINFDRGTFSVIVNKVTSVASGEPVYQEGQVERGKFITVPGPLEGTYKLQFGDAKDYAILAPTNSGHTILVLDPIVGMTGVCQRI